MYHWGTPATGNRSKKHGAVAQTCNPKTQEVETGGNCKFKPRLGCISGSKAVIATSQTNKQKGEVRVNKLPLCPQGAWDTVAFEANRKTKQPIVGLFF